jgi:hypothetical protein
MGTARSLSLRSMARHELDHKGNVELAGVLNAVADSIDRDAAEIARLRAALTESYQDNLYNAIHQGVNGNGGKWWPGGMSDAEWFCRQAGIGYEPRFTRQELLARVPEIADKMVQIVCNG